MSKSNKKVVKKMQELIMEDRYQKAYHGVKCIKGLFTHDISNLFHVIGNSIELCEMLLKEGMDKEELLEYFKLIGEQINRGKKLVKNVQNLSKLEEYGIPLESVDLFEVLKHAIQSVKTNYPNRSLDIIIYSKVKNLIVTANDLLLDVFENILMNSIVYNRNEIVHIDIVITEVKEYEEKFIRLEFKDNGIGIDEERKKEILREDHRKSQNSKGMGIGLSFIAKFIELCRGEMWIEDNIIGDYSKGSNFIILIPGSVKKNIYPYNYQII